MIIDKNLYVSRISKGSSAGTGKREKKCYRNWFLIKAQTSLTGYTGMLAIRSITFPKRFVGKKIRLKVEIIKEEGDIDDKN